MTIPKEKTQVVSLRDALRQSKQARNNRISSRTKALTPIVLKPDVRQQLANFKECIESVHIFGKPVKVIFMPRENTITIKPSVDLSIFDEEIPLSYKFNFSVESEIAKKNLACISETYFGWIKNKFDTMNIVKQFKTRLGQHREIK